MSQLLSHQKASALCSVTEQRFLIPYPLRLRLDAINHTSVFHHAASETRENTGQTKTSLNVRRANKAGVFTGVSVAAAGSGMAHLKTNLIQLQLFSNAAAG